jgi:hypothetical protein
LAQPSVNLSSYNWPPERLLSAPGVTHAAQQSEGKDLKHSLLYITQNLGAGSTSNMERRGVFEDYDNEQVYQRTQEQALDPNSRNFVVEFSLNGSQIAFNLDVEGIVQLYEQQTTFKDSVRWM